MCLSCWSFDSPTDTRAPEDIEDILEPVVSGFGRLGVQLLPSYRADSYPIPRSYTGEIELIVPNQHRPFAERLTSYCEANPLFELEDKCQELPGWYTLRGCMARGSRREALRQHWGEIAQLIEEYRTEQAAHPDHPLP